MLNYEKVELNKSSDMFGGKLINYTIKELNNFGYVLVLLQDMEYKKDYFETKNEPKYLNEPEAKSEFKKAILDARVRQYIDI